MDRLAREGRQSFGKPIERSCVRNAGALRSEFWATEFHQSNFADVAYSLLWFPLFICLVVRRFNECTSWPKRCVSEILLTGRYQKVRVEWVLGRLIIGTQCRWMNDSVFCYFNKKMNRRWPSWGSRRLPRGGNGAICCKLLSNCWFPAWFDEWILFNHSNDAQHKLEW